MNKPDEFLDKIEIELDPLIDGKMFLTEIMQIYADEQSREEAIKFANMFRHKYCSSMGGNIDEEFDEWKEGE